MRQVLQRITLHGLLTAGLLAVLGIGLARFSADGLAGHPVGHAAGSPQVAAMDRTPSESLHYRLPVMMAVWGFVFVAVAEMALYLWRGNPAKPVLKPVAAQPDHAEVLLEELLAQVESKKQAGETVGPSVPTPPSPLPVIGENSPTLPGEPRA
jgi:hypothetical protein